MNRLKWRMQAGSDADHLYLYDVIGGWNWEQDIPGVEAFRRELSGMSAPTLHVHINSPGGSVPDGVAMMSLLAAHPARKVTHVDGMALSMASAIAMIGAERRMAANGMLMIHDPWTIAQGNARDLRKAADMLDGWGGTFRHTYSSASGKTDDEIAELMASETWMTASEAKAAGFVTDIDDPLAIAACAVPDGIVSKAPEWARTLLAEAPAKPKEKKMGAIKRLLSALGVGGETEEDADRLASLVEVTEDDAEARDMFERGMTAADARAEVAAQKVRDEMGAELDLANARAEAAEAIAVELRADAESARREAAEAKAQAEAALAKVRSLAPGLKFDAASAGVEPSDPAEFMRAVDALVSDGMDRDKAILSVREQNPQAFAAYIAAANKNHR